MSQEIALPPGFALNEYRIDATLGVGGFGLTYLATDDNLSRKVAIKEYLPADLALRDADNSVRVRSENSVETFNWGRARFLDEARTLASFHHPNIVRVMRFFEANQTAYMVMEFVAGEALNEWLGRRRPLPQARVLSMALALLDGLEVVHRAGYMHRDIKPANIYMREDGSPVLLDFGSARAARAAGANNELTAIITPGYAPVEQYHAGGNQGPWSDIYSIGAVLYWMVVGAKPLESVARIRTDALAPAVRAGDLARYSPALLQAIDWALMPAEEMRPQSVSALREALAAVGPVPGSDSPTVIAGPLPTYQQAYSQPVSVTHSSLDSEALKKIETLLAMRIGPFAAVTIKRAAADASSNLDLIETVADEIDDEDARKAFIKDCAGVVRASDAREQSQLASAASRPASVHAAAPAPAPASRPVLAPLSRPLSAPPSAQISHPASVPSHRTSAPVSAPVSAPHSAQPFVATPEVLALAEAAIVKDNGAISKALVRRAASRARDQTEFFLLVADAIEDSAAQRAFLRKVLPTPGKR